MYFRALPAFVTVFVQPTLHLPLQVLIQSSARDVFKFLQLRTKQGDCNSHSCMLQLCIPELCIPKLCISKLGIFSRLGEAVTGGRL